MPPALRSQLPIHTKANSYSSSPANKKIANLFEQPCILAITHTNMPIRIRRTFYSSEASLPHMSRREPPHIDSQERSLRPRSPTTNLPLPVKSSKAGPSLPSPLKADILAKRAEWLETNELERAELSDPIEEELEMLERQALAINAVAFRRWRDRTYRDAE